MKKFLVAAATVVLSLGALSGAASAWVTPGGPNCPATGVPLTPTNPAYVKTSAGRQMAAYNYCQVATGANYYNGSTTAWHNSQLWVDKGSLSIYQWYVGGSGYLVSNGWYTRHS